METKWAFLQLWRESLLSVLQLPETAHDAGHSRVSFQCWPDALPDEQKFVTTDTCLLRVNFPTDARRRCDRESLQRIREALELFDFLAAVDNAAFASLLSDYLLPFQEGTEKRPLVFWPTWDCRLDGELASGDVVATKPIVTWGELFGCPHDPWEHSHEFRAAMTKLQKMKMGRGGNHHNKVVTSSWRVFSDVLLVFSHQKLVREGQRIRPSPCSRELSKLFELQAPHVVQLKALGDSTKLMETWTQQSPLRTTITPEPKETEFAAGLFSDPSVAEAALALAQTDMATLKLADADDGASLATNGAGFLLSTLIHGQPVCYPSGKSLPVLERTGRCPRWEIPINGVSGSRFGAIFSAFAEATSIETLVLTDDGVYRGPVYWSWLAYAFWSKATRTSVQSVDFSLVNVTKEVVAAVKRVAATNFPQPRKGLRRSKYGYVDIPTLRLKGSERALVASRDLRCRALYDNSRRNTVAEVVVPGYGVCEVRLVHGEAEFTNDASPPLQYTFNTHGVRSLSLTLSSVENDAVVPRLLAVIGGGLHSLSLEFRGERQVGLDLSALAAACPGLKELRLCNCNVELGREERALRAWGIAKLTLHETKMVRNLAVSLSNPAYRTSKKLVQLEVLVRPNDRIRILPDGVPPIVYRRYQKRAFSLYVQSLMAHDKEDLGVDEEKFAKTRCALISVVSRRSHLRAAQYLDSFMLSIILAFAATPEFRSVKAARFCPKMLK